MTKRESAKKDSLWLWDGEAEYEGELLTLGEGNLVARVREVRRFRLSTGAPGRPVPRDLLERQRELCRRVSFGQSRRSIWGRSWRSASTPFRRREIVASTTSLRGRSLRWPTSTWKP